MRLTGGLTRTDLVAELSEVVGAVHEARFIVDEALAPGLVSGHTRRTARTGRAGRSTVLDEDAVSSARRMAARRAAGEPLQYVFGHWPFRSLDLLVDSRVLIPRPETEQVVEVALGEARRLRAAAEARRPLVVVDAGTGSGAVALSLAEELEADARDAVWATDADPDALAVAAANLAALCRGRTGLLPGVSLAEGNWLEPLPPELLGAVDLVVSNPPYVSEREWEGLDAEVRTEPRQALVAGPASDGTPGLAAVEAVLVQSRRWLCAPGAVVVELAPHQADAATHLAVELGYAEVAVYPDLARRPRALVARTSARGRAG